MYSPGYEPTLIEMKHCPLVVTQECAYDRKFILVGTEEKWCKVNKIDQGWQHMQCIGPPQEFA
jgi:hypothetical protein